MGSNYKTPPRCVVTATLNGAAPLTTANFGEFFIATKKCVVKAASEVHVVKASDSGTVMLERLQGTETSGNGDDLLTTAFNILGNAETVQAGTLTTTVANLVLNAGDRLNLVDAGTFTAAVGICVSVELELVD